jgi:hypothetical protein
VSATTPLGDGVAAMSFSGSACPTSTGWMENRISSTRWCSSRVWLSRPVSVHHEVTAVLLFELGDGGDDVVADDCGVGPVGALQGRGEHVLVDCVDGVCVRPGLVGHDVSEVFVGASSHEHAVVGPERLSGCVSCVRIERRPGAAVFGDAVERDEGGIVICPRFRGHLSAWVCPTWREGCGVHGTGGRSKRSRTTIGLFGSASINASLASVLSNDSGALRHDGWSSPLGVPIAAKKCATAARPTARLPARVVATHAGRPRSNRVLIGPL